MAILSCIGGPCDGQSVGVSYDEWQQIIDGLTWNVLRPFGEVRDYMLPVNSPVAAKQPGPIHHPYKARELRRNGHFMGWALFPANWTVDRVGEELKRKEQANGE